MKSNFIRCGVIGWCWELIYTSLHTLASPDFDHKLMGKTSLFMFPIYGSAALLKPVVKVVKKKPFWVRGSIYTCLIYGAEFVTGKFLKKHGLSLGLQRCQAECRWGNPAGLCPRLVSLGADL